MRVGVDIGGTFTDLIAVDPVTGRLLAFKCLTTPEDLSRCFLAALAFANRERPGEEFAVMARPSPPTRFFKAAIMR